MQYIKPSVEGETDTTLIFDVTSKVRKNFKTVKNYWCHLVSQSGNDDIIPFKMEPTRIVFLIHLTFNFTVAKTTFVTASLSNHYEKLVTFNGH